MFRTQYSEDVFVDAFKRMADALAKIAEVSNRYPAPPPEHHPSRNFDDIRNLYRSGNKIEAIKLFRQLTGAGLKDAKDQVESIKDIY